MKIESQGDCLSISEIPELTAANSATFRDQVQSALRGSPSVIEINLSQTRFMDSSGARRALRPLPGHRTAPGCDPSPAEPRA